LAEGSKTEKATPKKRRDERKKGNVFMSKDAVSVATLLGSYAGIMAFIGIIAEQLARFMEYCLGLTGALGTGETIAAAPKVQLEAVMVTVKTVGPLLAITALCAVVATFAQTKFLVSADQIKPKFNRISPFQGFKRLFSLKSIIEALKGIIKIVILMVIIYISIRGMFPNLVKYLYVDLNAATRDMYDETMSMIQSIIIAFVALAAFDFMYQWWDYERQLKMTKQEVKEEYKQIEGNPQIKSKIRELQRKMAQGRMMQQVPQSDVVIRNPTHFAVALRYKPDQDSAPIVMALGQDEIAAKIVQVAEENKIPTIENPPLARALYANTQLNQEIPPEFYADVAEVLVYIFKLNGNKQIVKAG